MFPKHGRVMPDREPATQTSSDKYAVPPNATPEPPCKPDTDADSVSVTMAGYEKIDSERHRYPHCIVWTPLPIITWFLPFIGHMGICTSSGVIRDFAGPYHVSEDNMAFGNPTRYIRLDPAKASGGAAGWDHAVAKASEIYCGRMHNLFCDNCHSHVATALDLMAYGGKQNWNMVKLAFLALFCGRFVGFGGFLKTWLPAIIIYGLIAAFVVWGRMGF